jgi:hypothetical protein
VVCEAYAEAVGAEGPVCGCGRGFEVCEEGDSAFEGGEFAGGYGAEACIVEGTEVAEVNGSLEVLYE